MSASTNGGAIEPAPQAIVSNSSTGRLHRPASAPQSARPGSAGMLAMPGLGIPTAAAKSKAAHESAILITVKQQMDALEDKLSAQIVRAQQQGERFRDAAFSRVESKLATAEASQPRLDRRIAELCGNYKGLSDEMQSQIRRIDAMDTRLWEWRQKSDEELRNKLAGIEQSCQSVNSSIRVTKSTTDDIVKKLNQRILSLEERMNERATAAEETNITLRALVHRLNEVEEARLSDVAARFKEASEDKAMVLAMTSNQETPREVVALEAALASVLQKIDTMQQDSSDIHASLQEQEEKLRSLRTLHEAKEEQYRQLSDRVERENWDGRFKDIADKITELDRRRVDHSESLEILQKRLDGSEQAHEELCHTVRRVQERPVYAEQMTDEVDYSMGSVEPEPVDALADITALGFRVSRGEERLDALAAELGGVRQDIDSAQVLELAPRVNALVSQLTEVAPKIISQESVVRVLQEKLAKLDPGNGFASRVSSLEEEVKRLISEVEGADLGEDESEEGASEAAQRRGTASAAE